MAAGSATVQVMPLSAGVGGTVTTLREMAAFVRKDVRDEGLRIFAEQLVARVPGHDFYDEIRKLFLFARDSITYRRDPVATERVQDARRTIQRGVGDCDDKSVLLATLLGLLGHRARFVILSYTGATFDHVYLEVLYRNKWLPLDPTNEQASVGWERRGKVRKVFPIWPPSANLQDLEGFFGKIGGFFKKVGKGVLKAAPIGVSLIPGVGGAIASAGVSLIPSGGKSDAKALAAQQAEIEARIKEAEDKAFKRGKRAKKKEVKAILAKGAQSAAPASMQPQAKPQTGAAPARAPRAAQPKPVAPTGGLSPVTLALIAAGVILIANR